MKKVSLPKKGIKNPLFSPSFFLPFSAHFFALSHLADHKYAPRLKTSFSHPPPPRPFPSPPKYTHTSSRRWLTHASSHHSSFYLRRSRQIREKKALLFFLLLGGGLLLTWPSTVFWGVKRQKLCLKTGVLRQRLCLKRGAQRQKLCLKKGCEKEKLLKISGSFLNSPLICQIFPTYSTPQIRERIPFLFFLPSVPKVRPFKPGWPWTHRGGREGGRSRNREKWRDFMHLHTFDWDVLKT